MIPHYRQLYYTKQSLFVWMVSCFIFCGSSLNAANSGGNDTIASAGRSNISIDKQRIQIRNMTAEELTAFIDETFDMDSIPVDIINEINWAVAKLEKKENAFENVVSETPQPALDLPKIEETTKVQPIIEAVKVKEITPLKMLKNNTVKLRLDERSKSIAKAELKAPEMIVPIPKKENVQFLPVVKLTLTEKANDFPLAKELINVIEFTHVNKLRKKPVLLAVNTDASSVSIVELKPIEIIVPESYVVQSLPVAQLQATELGNEITPIHHIIKIKEAVNLKTFEKNNVALKVDNLIRSISIDELKIIEPIVEKRPTPLTLLKKNLANNTSNNNNTPTVRNELSEFKMSGPVNDLNASIPSPDYYVSWEINKLFPEKDMLKMKADTAITLVLLDKQHRHYFHPFNGPITSNFGWRDSAQHNGIDIDLNKGDKVSAAFDGMVRVARRYGGFGNVVIIRHYNGLETVYAHLSKIKVKPGQLISSGDLVGLGGSTGHSTGSHLHFEIRFKGVPINPKYLISLSQQKLMCDEFTLKKTKWGLAVYPKNTKLYTVEKGDTVFEIAKRFGTTTASIKELNHLSGGRVRLKAGQQINVAH